MASVKRIKADMQRELATYGMTINMILLAFVITLNKQKDDYGVTALQGLLDKINWKKAGVTREQFDTWWREHRENDRLARRLARATEREAIGEQ